MKIGLYLRPNFKSMSEVLSTLIDFLLSKNQEVIIPDYVQKDILNKDFPISFYSLDKMSEEVDAMFSVGGDGTFLGAARLMARTSKPVLGIHLGGMGFLADVSMDNYKEKLRAFFDRDYEIEERDVLSAEVKYEERSSSYFAFNDFVIDKGRLVMTMIKIKTFVDDDYFNTYRADGLIVSTPTGSTAYSLSAGGPIVCPHLNVITISPICPHSLSARPVVISADQKIRIDCYGFKNGVSLIVDGREYVPLHTASQVEIQKANFTLRIVRFRGDSFFQTLRTKMNWGRDIRGN